MNTGIGTFKLIKQLRTTRRRLRDENEKSVSNEPDPT
jgi:hypothetical protein